MTKIFIASPAFDGKVTVPFACALAETRLYLASHAIQTEVRITTAGSLLVRERNDLVKMFLQSDATHMMCIDSDIAWQPQDMKKLIDHNEDFVASLYPARGERCFLYRGVYEDNKTMRASEKGLLEMEYIPAGFMLLKRRVLEKMVEHFPELYYEPKDATFKHTKGHCLFDTEVWEGEFWGEDYVFCRRARQAGFRIWIDPVIPIHHAGITGAFVEAIMQKEAQDKLALEAQRVKPEEQNATNTQQIKEIG